MRIAFVLALVVALAGCKTTDPGTVIPVSRLVCADEPAIPEDPITDEKNSTYLRGMRGAWADCSSKLKWVRDFVSPK